jgi:hypothetical protein
MGIAVAVGIAIGLLEPMGLGAAGMVNALSYILWSLFLIALGIRLLRMPKVPAGQGTP